MNTKSLSLNIIIFKLRGFGNNKYLILIRRIFENPHRADFELVPILFLLFNE